MPPERGPSGDLSSLRAHLALLRREGELFEVETEVDPDQEIAEIHRRVIAADGPALLFKRVRGSRFPMVTNLFGTPRRVDLAFGPRPREVIRGLVDLVHAGGPPDLRTLWRSRSLLAQAFRLGTRRRASGPVSEVIEETPDLCSLPVIKSWPEDGGPFFTLPLVLTRDPRTQVPNLGIYRMQLHDAATTGMHWQIGKGGGFHHWTARELGQPLPVSVFLGGPPALLLSAIAPLPEGVPELLLAGLLLGRKLPVLQDPNSGHPIPTEAEFALVGEALPNETHPEGPFGDHYGYYSLTHDYPVFHCRRILHRRDAIYPATVVGKPRQEDFYLGDYLQELLSPLFPVVMPSVVDLWSYGETGFHSLSGAVVKDRYGREAMMSAFRILGEGQLSLTKFLLLTDSKIDLKNFPRFLEHVLARCRWETDFYILSNLSMDTLDYAGPRVNEGSKGVLMGLGEAIRELPKVWEGVPPAGALDPRVFCAGCLVVGGPSYEEDEDYAGRLARDPALEGWQLVVLCDRPRQCAASVINFLWTTFTRFEPATDLHPRSSVVHRHHISPSPPIVLDARMKPWYPKELFASAEISARVTRRWKEYFPVRAVEMGSSDLAHITPTMPGDSSV